MIASEPILNSNWTPHDPTRSGDADSDEDAATPPARPCIVELAGTPRAGKTTAMHGLARRLRKRDLRVEVVEEQATRCPVWSKRDPDFNIWTACKTLAQTIEASYNDAHVILIDRGAFDALCWMDWYAKLGCIGPDEQRAIDGLLTLRTLKEKIDLVVVMTVAPEEALRRELAAGPNGSPGSIVNPETLRMINDSIAAVTAARSDDFRLFPMDTTRRDPRQTLDRIARAVQARLRSPAAAPR